ncbi:MAG: hypothetical protein WKF75_18235 [Singulisphaera sp.]
MPDGPRRGEVMGEIAGGVAMRVARSGAYRPASGWADRQTLDLARAGLLLVVAETMMIGPANDGLVRRDSTRAGAHPVRLPRLLSR